MLSRSAALDLLDVEIAIKEAEQREALAPAYDWYGPDCGCPRAGRKVDGSCPEHPRARPNQRIPEGDWDIWMIRAGRGFGKTRAGAEWLKHMAMYGPEKGQYGLVGAVASDVRDIMIEGPSGLKAISPPWFEPKYEPTKRRLSWPNGVKALCYSSEQPRDFRGPAFHGVWCVAAGMLVATAEGHRPVEDVRPGDRVWTRSGLRRVVRAGLTGRAMPVFRVEANSGQVVRLTGDHRVFTENRGWVRCGDIRRADIINIWNSNQDLRLGTNGADSAGIATATATTRTGPAPSCTPPSGNAPAGGASPMATSSTTGTRTRPTTIPTTSRSSRRRSTVGCISPPGATDIPGSMPSRASGPGSGSSSSGRIGSPETSSVPDAPSHSSPRGCGPVSATRPAPRTSAVASVAPDGRADVYDLTVEGCPEFFAGGILVHNCDEFAKWSHLEECWDNLQFGMRLVSANLPDWVPKTCITTTPLPLPLVKELIADPATRVVNGSTYDNEANLAANYLRRIRAKYEGTRFGRQEIYGEILEDVPGALWRGEQLDACRVAYADVPQLDRVVVAVDPSAADPNVNPDRDTAECGIVVVGVAMLDHPSVGWCAHAYVLADVSLRAHPSVWGQRVIDAYHFHMADVVVAEVNNGGAMVESVLRSIDSGVSYKCLHASRGKQTRAQPVAALYDQGRVKHLREADLSAVEAQMTTWVPGAKSPDRMDALVWGVTEAVLEGAPLTVGRNPFPQYRG